MIARQLSMTTLNIERSGPKTQNRKKKINITPEPALAAIWLAKLASCSSPRTHLVSPSSSAVFANINQTLMLL
jgi:hypothetical protein